MRFIKLALISLFFLALIISAFSLMIPSHIQVSRMVNIKAPKDSVMNLIRQQEQWTRWNPVMVPHPDHPAVEVVNLQSTDSTVTALFRQGRKKPFPTAWQLYDIPGADSLTLRWYMDFDLPWYPWKKFEGMFYDKAYGPMMEEGLANIKKITQK